MMRSRVVLWIVLASPPAAALPIAGTGQPPSSPPTARSEIDARLVADFQTRVQDYAALHEKLEATLTPVPPGSGPEAIEQHQRALARLVGRARSGARQGDIFAPDIRAYFRRQLSRVFSGPDGLRFRESIRDEDTRALRLVVNGRYPTMAPLSTVPPQVLLLLPRLPEQLEYRFVGERLVLLDIHAAIVVDLMEKAVLR